MSDYLSRRHATMRKMLGLVLDEMRPWKVCTAAYEKALSQFNRADEAENLRINRGWGKPVVRTFCTCLECLGEGEVPNPAWQDDGAPGETESNDCDVCGGRGMVEVIDDPDPVGTPSSGGGVPF